MNPCRCEPNTFYQRKEKNGIITVAPRQGIQKHQVFFLNATAAGIFEMCDGERSLDEIAKALYEKYPQQDLSSLKNDVKITLDSLKQLGIINWQFFPKEDKEMDKMNEEKKVITMQVIADENITGLSEFIQSSVKNYHKNKHNRVCFLQVPFNTSELYAPFAVRVRHFHFLEVFYIMIKNTKVCGVVSLLNLNPARKTVEIGITIGNLKDEDNAVIYSLMDYVVEEVRKLGIIKIKYLIPCASTDLNFPIVADEAFQKFISENKFRLEATLANEIGKGIDLTIWSRQI